ncbi:hypothetical protein [Levilactobacillus fujinensis]|uniref:YtxH domain-containing protein n=1 Tax=Levilactobacillus fujinensis TaxID=2486024 RepID=A0ABW1TG29_9LACO|nr:hypothetical protein [Levilactobacillus fujinensis]
MKIGRFLVGSALAVGVGLAAYLTLTKQDPVTWSRHVGEQAKHTAAKFDDVKDAKDNLTQSTQRLTTTIDAAMPVLDDIQTDIEKFTFKIAPRVEKIEETVSRWDDA